MINVLEGKSVEINVSPAKGRRDYNLVESEGFPRVFGRVCYSRDSVHFFNELDF